MSWSSAVLRISFQEGKYRSPLKRIDMTKNRRIGALVSSVLFAAALHASAAPLSYRGTLQDGGRPAEGRYDIELALYSAERGGQPLAGPLTLFDVAVRAGKFEAAADFGPQAVATAGTWLGVGVRSAGSHETFVPLDSRTAVDLTTTTSVCPGAWTVFGNAGTNPGTGANQNYLGTADSAALTFAVNGVTAGKLTPSINGAFYPPNIVFGFSENATYASTQGATIAGGGGFCGIDDCPNIAGGDSSSIGGGYGNSAAGAASVIGGGSQNLATGRNGIVPGGAGNNAGGDFSLAAGYLATVRNAAAAGCNGSLCGDYGTFVWADVDGGFEPFVSSGARQFLIRAHGGFGLNGAPHSANAEMTLYGSDGNVDLTMFPKTGSNPDQYAALGYALVATADDNFFITHTNQVNTFTQRFRIDPNGNTYNATGAWSTFSDRRLKRGIEPIRHALATLLDLRGRSFEYTEPDLAAAAPGPRMGFIAQDVETVLPQWVGEDSRGYKMVTPQGFEALTVEAMRELRVEKDEEISALREEIESLRARLDVIEAARTN
jgi:endosialidase-like protein